MLQGLEARAWVWIPGTQHSRDLKNICLKANSEAMG